MVDDSTQPVGSNSPKALTSSRAELFHAVISRSASRTSQGEALGYKPSTRPQVRIAVTKVPFTVENLTELPTLRL
jgi:hypothetical protein